MAYAPVLEAGAARREGSSPSGYTMVTSLDTETHRFRPGCKAPPIVCVSTATGLGTELYHVNAGAREATAEALQGVIVGHNIAYDMACICAKWPELTGLVWAAYDQGRVRDTMIRQWLIDTASGDFEGFYNNTHIDPPRAGKIGYSLASLAERHLGIRMAKGEDTWRTRYAELEPLPLEAWPADAQAYSRMDAKITLDVYNAQGGGVITDEQAQVRAYWWLHLSSVWGPVVDQRKVDALEASWRAEYDTIAAELERNGLKRADRVDRSGQVKRGARDTKAVMSRIASVMPVIPAEWYTPTGQIKTDEDTCLKTGDPLLASYARFGSLTKHLSTDLALLRSAGNSPIHCRYGWAESGRSTCSDPNLQNTPRKGGIKECFVPRAGCVFAIIDAAGLELATMAQAWVDMLNYSRLAETIRAGIDPHLEIAAEILGISYDVALAHKKDPRVKDARQTGKVANFGFPGGLGIARLVDFARILYQVILTPEQAKHLKELWLRLRPEAREYFRLIDSAVTAHGTVVQVRSGRVRGGLDYTSACNTMFQGLGADVMKDLGYRIAREQYTDPNSPLWASRTVVFEHDAFIVEVPEAMGHEAAMRLEELMSGVGAAWLPAVGLRGECALARCWQKDPERVFIDGRMVAP